MQQKSLAHTCTADDGLKRVFKFLNSLEDKPVKHIMKETVLWQKHFSTIKKFGSESGCTSSSKREKM